MAKDKGGREAKKPKQNKKITSAPSGTSPVTALEQRRAKGPTAR